MPPHSALEITRHLLREAAREQLSLTNLQLQKILYYAQGWHVAFFRKPLFPEALEAWQHGPVCPPVYRAWNQLTTSKDTAPIGLPEEVVDFLDEILATYGRKPAAQLYQDTHSEAPWVNARGGLPPEAPSNQVISISELDAYFSARTITATEYEGAFRKAVEEGIAAAEKDGVVSHSQFLARRARRRGTKP